MISLRKLAAPVAVAAALPGTFVMAGAPEAQAACGQQGESWRTVQYLGQVRVPYRDVPVFSDGPGGTISVSQTYSGTVSKSFSGNFSVEGGWVVAKVKAEISSTISSSTTRAITHTYSHNVNRGKTGHMQYVSYGIKVRWTRGHITVGAHGWCVGKTDAQGTAVFPRPKYQGWYYWES